MTILLLTLAVAFAAFCVWLTVRIVNRWERWAKWTLAAAVVGVPVLYVLSFGPVCGLIGLDQLDFVPTLGFYRPILMAVNRGPTSIREAVVGYARFFGGESAADWLLAFNADGH